MGSSIASFLMFQNIAKVAHYLPKMAYFVHGHGSFLQVASVFCKLQVFFVSYKLVSYKLQVSFLQVICML